MGVMQRDLPHGPCVHPILLPVAGHLPPSAPLLLGSRAAASTVVWPPGQRTWQPAGENRQTTCDPLKSWKTGK